MIEKVVLDYLGEKLGVTVLAERPAREPEKYVLLEKTGSSTENYIEWATLAVQSYAPTMYEAMLLNAQVKSAMREITALQDISRCDCNSDYNYTDTAKKEYRYQAVFDIVYLGGD